MADPVTREDRTALSYWFPKLLAAGLPVPKTVLLKMSDAAQKDVWDGFDGKGDADALLKFADEVQAAAAKLGLPFFLRTDHTSAKHEWKETCFVDDADLIPNHIFKIAESSECADILGLPWDTWAIRELLPTMKFGVCPRYGDMPICREFRFFVDDSKILCFHPYWPRESLEQGGATSELDYEALCAPPPEAVFGLAARAGAAVGGAWSVDIVETEGNLWYVTDMAEASKSFHWEGCPHADGELVK